MARGLRGSTRRSYATYLEHAAALVARPGLVADAYRELDERWAEPTQPVERPDAVPAEMAEPLTQLADAETTAAAALLDEMA